MADCDDRLEAWAKARRKKLDESSEETVREIMQRIRSMPEESFSPRPRRSRRMATAAAFLILSVGGAVGYYLASSTQSPPPPRRSTFAATVRCSALASPEPPLGDESLVAVDRYRSLFSEDT